jgi:hypothetical protein
MALNIVELAALAKMLEDNSDKLAFEGRAKVLQGWEENSNLERGLIGMPAPPITIPVKLDPDLAAALKAGAGDQTILLVQLIRLIRSDIEARAPKAVEPAKVQIVEESTSGGATSQPAPNG